MYMYPIAKAAQLAQLASESWLGSCFPAPRTLCKSYTSIGWAVCCLSISTDFFSWYASGQCVFECVSMLLVSAHPEDVRVNAQSVFDLQFSFLRR